jgi:hypothetical protein
MRRSLATVSQAASFIPDNADPPRLFFRVDRELPIRIFYREGSMDGSAQNKTAAFLNQSFCLRFASGFDKERSGKGEAGFYGVGFHTASLKRIKPPLQAASGSFFVSFSQHFFTFKAYRPLDNAFSGKFIKNIKRLSLPGFYQLFGFFCAQPIKRHPEVILRALDIVKISDKPAFVIVRPPTISILDIAIDDISYVCEERSADVFFGIIQTA